MNYMLYMDLNKCIILYNYILRRCDRNLIIYTVCINQYDYMAEPASGKNEANPVF